MPDRRMLPVDLPNDTQAQLNFLESSFFRSASETQRDLPTPAEVREVSGEHRTKTEPPPVIFEHLNLIVKFGPHVLVSEATCLYAIRTALGDRIRVPEVYGWRVDGGEVFLYMELLQGVTLLSLWDSLNENDKTTICNDLREIVTALRQVEQDPNDAFIGSINHQPLSDIVFRGKPIGGPFGTVKAFHDWFSSLAWLGLPLPEGFQDPWRESLPDDAAVKLTHGDLHRGNILISTAQPYRVVAIVDWAHCGWYPDYWEYCKAAYTSAFDGDWRLIWIPKFLEPQEEEHHIFAQYTAAMGAI